MSQQRPSIWQDVPESVLLHIFSFLDVVSLGRLAQTCKLWNRISADESLWQDLVKHKWRMRIKHKLPKERTSWKSEYKRLYYHCPVVEADVEKVHRNEVLDVQFSHRGDYFVTVCRNAIIMLWDVANTSMVAFENTAHSLGWKYITAIRFNQDDTRLLVCGCKKEGEVEEESLYDDGTVGRVAALSVPGLIIFCIVPVDPPQLQAAWLTTSDFVVGHFMWDYYGALRFYKYTVPETHLPYTFDRRIQEECSDTMGRKIIPDMQPSFVFTPCGKFQHSMDLSIAEIRHTLDDALVVNNKQPKVKPCCEKITKATGRTCLHKRKYDSKEIQLINAKRTKCSKHSTSNKDSLRRYSSPRPTTRHARSPSHMCDKDGVHNQSVNNKRLSSLPERTRKLLVFVTQGIENNIYIHHIEDTCGILTRADTHETPCRSNGCGPDGQDDEDEAIPDDAVDEQAPARIAIKTFLPGGNISLRKKDLDKPDHIIHLGQREITGTCLSQDGRYLFVNYRDFTCPQDFDTNIPVPFFDDAVQQLYEECRYSRQHKICVIDLLTVELLPDVMYERHTGGDDITSFYMCLGASKDFLASASLHAAIYLWDRLYQTVIGVLGHTNGLVNGIAFCPTNQEILVTVADDHNIKVWKSRQEMKKLQEAKLIRDHP